MRPAGAAWETGSFCGRVISHETTPGFWCATMPSISAACLWPRMVHDTLPAFPLGIQGPEDSAGSIERDDDQLAKGESTPRPSRVAPTDSRRPRPPLPLLDLRYLELVVALKEHPVLLQLLRL